MNQSEANFTFNYHFTFDEYEYGIVTLFSINFFLGLPANIYVLYQIVSGGYGAVASEVFALNLAVGEALFCIFSLYCLIHFLLEMDLFIWYLLVSVMMQLMFISRPIFQGWICLERYLAVVHPTVFLRFKPLRYRLPCCTVTWLLILLDSIVNPLLLDTLQFFCLFIFKCLFMLVLMLYCGAHALCVLRKPGPGDGGGEHRSPSSTKGKAFKVIMITVSFFIVTLSIKIFVLGPALMFGSYEVTSRAILFAVFVSIISGFVSPLLYLHRAGKLPCIKF